MRKMILGALVMGLALVSVASAQPSGPSGTIYFVQNNGTTMSLGYLDINTDWTAIGSATALSSYSLLEAPPEGLPQELTADAGAWFNPATGLQNETALHSGYIAITGRFNNQQDSASSNANAGGTGADEFDKGSDIVRLDSTFGTPVQTVLNDGFDQTGSQPNTTAGSAYERVVVDSGFTPNGEASGYYFVNNGGNADVWTSSGGNYDIATPTGFDRHSLTGTTYPNEPGKYANLTSSGAATVNFGSGPVAVTGVVMTENGSSVFGGTDCWAFTYKKAAGGYQTVYSNSTTAPADYCGMYDNDQMLVGDTNNDGKVDVYYLGDHNGTYQYIHASDKQGDGTIMDLGDFCSAHLVGTFKDELKFGATALVDTGTKFANGNDQWAILYWLENGSGSNLIGGTYTNAVAISFLDSNGDFSEGEYGTTQIITNTTGTIDQADGGWGSIVWVPLGQEASVPEPATMMLVGSGVLGLAGVLRRKLMS